MSARRYRQTFSSLVLAVTFIVTGCALAFAQADFNESTIPPSSPPSRVVRPSTDTDESAESEPKPVVKPDHPANMIPYTVRPGDTIGAIAQMFGITPEELAHANRIHVDEPLDIDEVLKVPHPFTTEVNTLRSQVETLSAQQQAAEQKSDAAEEQVKSLQTQVQQLTGDNQDLNVGVKLLPWWRATAVSLGILAVVLFGVMLLTMFEWWRMRRRFVALAAMTDALSRLDYKYKAMFAKAELRLQQLYGRRRGGITEGQPRPKMPEEMEIERLNEELKQILELHLQRMGAKLPGSRRKGWREMFGGGDVGSTVEARSYRR
ncbi:MAG TPA: LysM peptidoglycan-binding domain-containing protein [Candidatus Acidoferrales bacterium]|jgi:LysM repeat protein|nr:LysM peptidoglycan-binding domain-containing protein [Candidatus Acidoferrales bacterium]